MAELHIERLEGRYHLPPSRTGERERLDRLLPVAAGEALEAGLERLGLAGDGELCIREVRVPLRLRLSASDDALTLAWGDAMAEAVAAALRLGDEEQVLRFASRRQALADFALGVACGDLRHAWAFRQIGLWQEEEEPVEGLARALAAEPEALVPVLMAVAEAGTLAALARQFEVGWWPQLAALALTSVGWSSFSLSFVAPAEVGEPEAGKSADPAAAAAPRSPVPGLAGAKLRRARLALLFDLLRPAPGSPLGQTLAALVYLEVDPGRLRAWPPEGRAELLSAAAAELAPSRVDLRALPQDSPDPGTRASDQGGGLADGAVAAAPWAESGPISMPPANRRAAEISASGTAESAPLVNRRLGFTEWGGLLFLVGVADDLGLPEEVAAHAVLGQRPGRWVWHQLALQLVPLGAEDPAALAFTGLMPGNKSPSFEAESASDAEQQALATLAKRVLREAAARLQARAQRAAPVADPPPAPDPGGDGSLEALVDLICRRQARILADPGWIEIHFPLGDVDTAIRRARLDLDPGFVPWLGVVLRFVYE